MNRTNLRTQTAYENMTNQIACFDIAILNCSFSICLKLEQIRGGENFSPLGFNYKI